MNLSLPFTVVSFAKEPLFTSFVKDQRAPFYIFCKRALLHRDLFRSGVKEKKPQFHIFCRSCFIGANMNPCLPFTVVSFAKEPLSTSFLKEQRALFHFFCTRAYQKKWKRNKKKETSFVKEHIFCKRALFHRDYDESSFTSDISKTHLEIFGFRWYSESTPHWYKLFLFDIFK